MPKNRIITATGGANSALQNAIAAADPKQASLATVIIDAFKNVEGAVIAVMDLARGVVGVYAENIGNTLFTPFNATSGNGNFNGTFATLVPSSPTGSANWSITTPGIYTPATPAVMAPQDVWYSGDPEFLSVASGAEMIQGTAESDQFKLGEYLVKPTAPTLTLQSALGRIEDALAEAGTSGVAVVSQVDNNIRLKIASAASINAATDLTNLSGVLARFLGEPIVAGSTVRRFGE